MKAEQFDVHETMEDHHWWFVARRQILCALVRDLLPAGTNHLVVDVGCGTGANIAALAADYRCVGIDVSELAIKAARRRFPAVEFIQGLAPRDLGDLAPQADVFLLTDVLEHIDEDVHAFGELLSASRPGAFFVVTVPAGPELWTEHDRAFGHYRRYTQPGFRAVWDGQPVTELLVSYVNSRLYWPIRAMRAINRRTGAVSGEGGTDFKMSAAPVNNLLTTVFAAEGPVLVRALRGEGHGYHRGVSLVAVLRREQDLAQVGVEAMA